MFFEMVKVTGTVTFTLWQLVWSLMMLFLYTFVYAFKRKKGFLYSHAHVVNPFFRVSELRIVLKNLAPSVALKLSDNLNKKLAKSHATGRLKRFPLCVDRRKETKADSNILLQATGNQISLTCICSQLMKHIITNNMIPHLKENKILFIFSM